MGLIYLEPTIVFFKSSMPVYVPEEKTSFSYATHTFG